MRVASRRIEVAAYQRAPPVVAMEYGMGQQAAAAVRLFGVDAQRRP